MKFIFGYAQDLMNHSEEGEGFWSKHFERPD